MTDEATLKSQGVSVLRSAASRPQAQYWQLGQFPSAQAGVQGRSDVSLEAMALRSWVGALPTDMWSSVSRTQRIT